MGGVEISLPCFTSLLSTTFPTSKFPLILSNFQSLSLFLCISFLFDVLIIHAHCAFLAAGGRATLLATIIVAGGIAEISGRLNRLDLRELGNEKRILRNGTCMASLVFESRDLVCCARIRNASLVGWVRLAGVRCVERGARWIHKRLLHIHESLT